MEKIFTALLAIPTVPNFEICRTFLRAKHVGDKRGKFQFVVEIAHKAVIFILFSL